MEFKIINWNIAGAKYLEEKEKERAEFRRAVNGALRELAKKHKPNVITLQEIVRYGKSSHAAEDIVDCPDGYKYYSFPLIDSDRLSSRAKWNKVKQLGAWPPDTFFAQGNAMLFKNDLPHFPVWSLPASCDHKPQRDGHFIEQVNLESGLYFGDRNTEPRAALVAHMVFTPRGTNGKPLDVFVINLHLTTLMMEREGIPEIDEEASKIRLSQINTIFNGIVSRYNTWRQQGYLERGERRMPEEWENYDRYPPVWILAGDFNATPESVEYEKIERMNFMDVVPIKGSGTKAKGHGKRATLTLDYIFAGPKFIALDPLITEHAVKDNRVDPDVKVSDHYPMVAAIPLAIHALEE